jgi:hypothetical protein
MLQISSAESGWLKQQAQRGAEATVVVYVRRTPAHAINVTASIAGRDPNLAPLVFMAPRSGWWQCVSEQGSRLVCWLEVMRVLAAGRPARECHFVALSGHELAFMGMPPYLKARQALVETAEAWIFLGSDIGAPRQPNLIHASNDALEQWIVTALGEQGLSVDAKEQHSSRARGARRDCRYSAWRRPVCHLGVRKPSFPQCGRPLAGGGRCFTPGPLQ